MKGNHHVYHHVYSSVYMCRKAEVNTQGCKHEVMRSLCIGGSGYTQYTWPAVAQHPLKGSTSRSSPRSAATVRARTPKVASCSCVSSPHALEIWSVHCRTFGNQVANASRHRPPSRRDFYCKYGFKGRLCAVRAEHGAW